MLAVQAFCHTSQKDDGPVSHFVHRLERSFQVAYGCDCLRNEISYTLLHSQLQEGLHYELMKAPSVSGALTYQALVMAAKNEERRIEAGYTGKQAQINHLPHHRILVPSQGPAPIVSHWRERELKEITLGPFNVTTVEEMATLNC